ncbi:Uncharacterised protein [Vibrio cholerae]|nr:Uncharacterised protein [Vibrio cholerae]
MFTAYSTTNLNIGGCAREQASNQIQLACCGIFRAS